MLRALVNVVLHGSPTKNQYGVPSTQADLFIAHFLKFISVKHSQNQKRITYSVGVKTQQHLVFRHAKILGNSYADVYWSNATR